MNDRITLFLMSRKGYRVLEALGNDFRDLVDFVVTARDANVENDYCEEIQELCRHLGISTFDRRDKYDVTSRYAIAVSWRWLINLQETELIVFHDSLLPKYRGFNPLVSYLINGEKQIGVTALFASEEYDRGDMLGQSATGISYPLKISEAIETVSENYASLAAYIARQIQSGNALVATPQNEAEASYSLWRDEEDYRIDWARSAQEIRRLVDAVGSPYKGAATMVQNRPARVFDVEEVEDVQIENRVPGKVIFVRDSFPVVVCGEGLIKILTLIDSETGESLLPLRSFRSRFS
jgi:methionyl-tRNA formyltransferase